MKNEITTPNMQQQNKATYKRRRKKLKNENYELSFHFRSFLMEILN